MGKNKERFNITAFYSLICLERINVGKFSEEASGLLKIIKENYFKKRVWRYMPLFGLFWLSDLGKKFIFLFIKKGIKTRPEMYLALRRYAEKQFFEWTKKEEQVYFISLGSGFDLSFKKVISKGNEHFFFGFDLEPQADFMNCLNHEECEKKKKCFVTKNLEESKLVYNGKNKKIKTFTIANGLFSYLKKQALFDRLNDLAEFSEKGSEVHFTLGFSKKPPVDEKIAKLFGNNIIEFFSRKKTSTKYIGDYRYSFYRASAMDNFVTKLKIATGNDWEIVDILSPDTLFQKMNISLPPSDKEDSHMVVLRRN